MAQSEYELNIVNSDHTTLFSDNDITYVIPLYQRAYAWKEREIEQLIEDICDCEDENYFLGTLVVDRLGSRYEVIDGQQRLTTLFLLLKCLNDYDVKNILKFECRDRSNRSLEKFDSLENEDYFESSILEGKIVISKKLQEKEISDKLKYNLPKVKLYRIEVPKHTDLNRYFEIMNTRGEQLEQHDILKALLLGMAPKKKRPLLAKVWDCCSDMTGYVQMHFPTDMRELLFSEWWNCCPEKEFSDKVSLNDSHDAGEDIRSIVGKPLEMGMPSDDTEEDKRIRFESIIEFPYFLLHALRIYVDINNITGQDGKELLGKQLDDKKLLSDFKDVIENDGIDGEKLAVGFIEMLLRLRFNFDKYIIKREFVNEGSDGEWSLKTLCVSEGRKKDKNKKAYYKDTEFRNYREWEITYKKRNPHPRIIKLQSCYRVSYTSPKVMHWITETLRSACDDELSWYDFEVRLEQIAKSEVKEFLDGGNFEMGIGTPHIVLNYLDYLLWNRNSDRYKNFVFEFRNSVEHWYPRNPSKETFEYWPKTEGVDRFGNLCLIQRDVNSKFSNASPVHKKGYDKIIQKGSLKLRLMADMEYTNAEWRSTLCKKHEDEMISILKNAVYG